MSDPPTSRRSEPWQDHGEFPDVVELNVGGRFFQTTLLTLTKDPDTMLGAMFSGKHQQPQDRDGRYFIDADGDTFAFVLRYLRHRQLPPTHLSEDVYAAAQFFGVKDLMHELEFMPQIMLKKIRVAFLAHYTGMEDTVQQLLEAALETVRHSPTLTPRLALVVSVVNPSRTPRISPWRPPRSNHGVRHHCAFSGRPDFTGSGPLWDRHRADLLVRPRDLATVTEQMYVDVLVAEMTHRGYTAQQQRVGNCNEGFEPQEGGGGQELLTEGCGAEMYRVCLLWQQSAAPS